MNNAELIMGLRWCADESICCDDFSGEKCPYFDEKKDSCSVDEILHDAADALEADERLLDQNTERCEALRKQLREAHENYEKHLNELEAQMTKWTSVKNQLPEESGEYIVYIQMGNGVEVPDFFGSNDLSYVTSMYFKKGQGLWLDEYDEAYNADLSLVDTANEYHITHWMPLPQKPKGEK